MNPVNIEFWTHDIGVNPIPADTRIKRTYEEWSQWQDKPIPDEILTEWKRAGKFEKGCAIIVGRIWRGSYKGKYLCCIDIDNKSGLDNFLQQFGDDFTLERLAEKTLVEWHLDDKNRVHIYFIVEKPLSKKSGINISNSDPVIDRDSIPSIEVKSEGKHGIMYCSPSFHKDGYRYEIIGTRIPMVLNIEQSQDLDNRINEIYAKYSSSWQQQGDNYQTPIEELFKNEFQVYEGNNRHGYLLRAMESLIQRNRTILSEDKIIKLSHEWNQKHCRPPLDEKEFEEQWNDAKKFLKRKSNDRIKESQTDLPNVSVADLITSIRERCVEIFQDQINVFYVTIRINDHVESIPLQSNRFKSIIRKEFFDKTGTLISDEKLDGVLRLIESQSMFDDNIRRINLSLRVAKLNQDLDKENNNLAFIYDLTTPKWEFVTISADEGWKIITDNQEPIFKRYENNCCPQIYPSREYPKDIFEKFLKLFNFQSKKDILLFSVYLISLFIPEIPKVILIIRGTGGGAKTTTFRMIKEIVDPSSVDTFSFPKQINDLVQTLDHLYVNFFDNVSFISDEVSDLLCRAVTGSGNMKRALYTTDIDFVYKYKRCIGINGINLASTRADFLDRSLIIEVKRIEKEKRRKEEVINKEFHELKPLVLGFIFDLLVKVLKYRQEHGNEQILKNGYPRMADSAEWGEIISRSLGYENDEFLNAYYENISNQNDEVIESSPVAEALLLFVFEMEKEHWEGSPTRLYRELTDIIDQIKPELKRSKEWPKASNKLTSILNSVANNLKEKGIEVITGERDSHGNRIIKIHNLIKNSKCRVSEDNNVVNSSNQKDSSQFNPHIHRIGYSDNFECSLCPLVGDIHLMKSHICSGQGH